LRGQRHHAFLVAVGVVLVAKGNLVVLEADQSVIGNGDAVGVAGKIAQDMLGAAERRFEVDHPVLPEQGTQEGGKGSILTERLEGSRESELGMASF
jgi:xanthine/CO dehydrogenase XdhC/CoxF family maturation factor